MPGQAKDDELVMNLVDLALAKPREERLAFLRQACSGDAELFRQTLTYVEWQDRMGGFLEKPLFQPLTVEHPFAEGAVLDGRFRIDREVAQGGMGVVYEAWDEKLDRRIAIKCAKTGFRKRLPPEVRHAREITHPNVCRIFEIHTAHTAAGEFDFVTMEFLDGETLAKRLERGPVPEREARAIARQLCAGLAAAHSHGVVHGDLKAGNVILARSADGSQRAAITDFGMARARESGQSTVQSGEGGGTLGYMAPELLQGGRATPASDVYALGVLLHELAAGRKPDPGGIAAPLPEPWRSIVRKCLAEDPAQRYESAVAVAKAFEPSHARLWFLAAAAAVLIAVSTAVVAHRVASAPQEVVSLAMLPFEAPAELAPFAKQVFEEASANLVKLTGGTRARYSAVKLNIGDAHLPVDALAKRGVTHALHGALSKEKNQLVVHALLTDTRTGVNARDWTMVYKLGQERYIPVSLAGVVTGTLHLPPLAIPAINAVAQADYDAGSVLLRRDATIDAALAAFENAVAKDPDSALAYAGLAEAQWAKYSITRNDQWLSNAAQSETEAQRRNPDLARALFAGGTLKLIHSGYEQAISDFLRGIELNPNYSDAYRHLGRTYELNGQPERALAAFKRAVETDPTYYRPYLNLGNFYLYRYRNSEAVEPLRRAVDLARDEPDARIPLVIAYMNLGRFEEAEKEIRAALAFRETALSLDQLGLTLMYRRDEQGAVPVFKKALNISPKNFYSWMGLGICYRRLGLMEPAEQANRAGLKCAEAEKQRNPRWASARAYVAYFHAALGNRSLAESEIAQALTFSTDGTEVRWTAVLTYETLGEREAALSVAASSPPQLLADLNRWPDLEGLRRDSRFAKMLEARNGR